MPKKKKKTNKQNVIQSSDTSENYKEIIKAFDEEMALRKKKRFDCSECEHVHIGDVTCDAFPKCIPHQIWHGSVRYTKPYPGDNWIRFKRKKK